MTELLTERTQRLYARLAGFLLLWLIATGLTGALLSSHIAGSGAFAEVARRIAASEHLYRLGLTCELVETLSAALLAFALYVTLEPVDPRLARLAMYLRLGESFVGGTGVIISFAQLRVYTANTPLPGVSADEARALVDLMRSAGTASYFISATFFSVGSLLFFRVFLKSGYIPRALSVLGIVASVVVTLLCLGSLIVPEYGSVLQYGWAPMALAEVATGVWLILFGVTKGPRAADLPAA